MYIYSVFIFFFSSYCVAGRTTGFSGYDTLKYNTFEKIESHLKTINSSLPRLTKLSSIGKTFEENNIWQLTLSNGPLNFRKKIVWIDCGMQARDWITHSTCMYIIDSISSHLLRERINEDIEDLLNSFDFVIIPVVNPDGYIESWNNGKRDWRKNMKPVTKFCVGVFISQNFPFQFNQEYSNHYEECKDDYNGPDAGSEEETKSIMTSLEDLYEKRDIFAVFHLESNGKKWLYPWSYTIVSSPVEQALQKFCQNGISAIETISKEKYTCGQISKIEKINRGGTFIGYAHYLGISTVYLLALRSGQLEFPFEVPEDQIEVTGEEIFGGISAAVRSKRYTAECEDTSQINSYHDFFEIEKHLFCLNETFPNTIKLQEIGKRTYENKPIWMLHISRNFAEERPMVWIVCGMQGRDWIIPAACMYIVDMVVNNIQNKKDEAIEATLSTHDFIILPVVNPDGYIRSFAVNNRHWIKNTNENGVCDGIFVSQNFPYYYNSIYSDKEECSEDYIGPSSRSEVESKDLSGIMESFKDRLFMVFNLESSGQKWMYPWSYTDEPSDYFDCLKRNCESGTDAMYLTANRVYTCDQYSIGDKKRGGTFIDYVHKYLEVDLVYSIASRAGDTTPWVIHSKEIMETGEETGRGILAAVNKAKSDPCTTNIPIKPLPVIPDPPNE